MTALARSSRNVSDPITSLLKAAVEQLAFLLRIREAAISILGPETAILLRSLHRNVSTAGKLKICHYFSFPHASLFIIHTIRLLDAV
jgi:hypothetical protein